jgi:hypothetical protein
MAFNIKRAASETYNKAVLKARELQEEDQRKKGYKVSIVVENEDGKRLLINTFGVRGHVQLDDFEEEKIRKFLGHDLGAIRSHILKGTKWADRGERVTFVFTTPEKPKSQPKPILKTRLDAPRNTKFKPLPNILRPSKKAQRSTISTRRGYYSATLGRWVNG